MLVSRLLPVDDSSTIYHYCSTSTLIEIVRNRTIRFSDINMLNDEEEGRWGYGIFLEAANKLLKREGVPESVPMVGEDFIDRLDEVWFKSRLSLASFVACFSKDGDSLSQWRAYASDGAGFAIGFAASELRRMPIQLLEVEYDHEQQVQEMLVALTAILLELKDRKEDLDGPCCEDELPNSQLHPSLSRIPPFGMRRK